MYQSKKNKGLCSASKVWLYFWKGLAAVSRIQNEVAGIFLLVGGKEGWRRFSFSPYRACYSKY